LIQFYAEELTRGGHCFGLGLMPRISSEATFWTHDEVITASDITLNVEGYAALDSGVVRTQHVDYSPRVSRTEDSSGSDGFDAHRYAPIGSALSGRR
jgi:hypothetical protein